MSGTLPLVTNSKAQLLVVMPPELLAKAFSFLDVRDYYIAKGVCKELQAIRWYGRLALRSYELPELETRFRSPRKEQDTVRLFDSHSLEVNLPFSRLIGRKCNGQRVTQERVEALFERIRFHCSEVTHLLIAKAAESPCRALLAGLPALTSLDLQKVDVDDWSTIPTLCPKLQSLSIDSDYSYDERMQQAATISILWKLQIGMNVTDAGLTDLAKHPSLRAIEMVGCSKVTNAGIRQLATIPNLEAFTFGNCSKVDDLTPLASRETLRSLHCNAVYGGRLPRVLLSLRGSQLEVLEVNFCADFDDLCLQEIGTMSKLRRLIFTKPLTGLLTDKGLGPLAGCHELRSLTVDTRDNFGGNTNLSKWQFTTAGLVAFIAQLPQFCELNVRNCGIGTVDADKIEETFKLRSDFRVVKPTKAEKKEDGKAKP